jgi:hypothetical protein
MENKNLRVDGAIIMWSLAETSYLAAIRDGLANLGYGSYIPTARTFAAALRDALREVCGNSKTLIRPLATEGGTEGFVVVSENRGTDNNEFLTDLVAKVTPEPRIKLRPFDERAQPITDAFNKQLGLIKPASVTSSLTGILGSLGGTTLRPHGGVYWLPGYSLKEWLEVSKVVEASGCEGTNCMYLARHSLDPDAVRMVHDAVVHEIRRDVLRIGTEITEGGLGNRALESRKAEAYAMRTKIKEYADILDRDLSHLLKAVEDTETSIAQAEIIAAGSAA